MLDTRRVRARYFFFFICSNILSKFIPRSIDVFRITVIKKGGERRAETPLMENLYPDCRFAAFRGRTVRLRSPNERESNARTTRPLVTLRGTSGTRANYELIPAENGQCYPFKIYPTPYGENLCPRFLFVLGNISLESWASLERVYTPRFLSLVSSRGSLGSTSNHPSSYEGCDRQRKGSKEKLCIEGGFLRDRRLSLIFDRLRDASCIIDILEILVEFPFFFYPVTTNFLFFLPTLKNTREIRCENLEDSNVSFFQKY